MNLPKHLLIGGIEYSIKLKNNVFDGNQPCWGKTIYDDSTITILSSLSEQKQRQTMIHEITHAMLHEAGLENVCNDETIVNPFGNMLYQVLIQNPDLMNSHSNQLEALKKFGYKNGGIPKNTNQKSV